MREDGIRLYFGAGCIFMNCVSIDISKGKVQLLSCTLSELMKLTNLLKNLDREARAVKEFTDNYHMIIAQTLPNVGVYVL